MSALRKQNHEIFILNSVMRGTTPWMENLTIASTVPEDSVDDVPYQQGIYAFKIRITDTIMPEHSIIVYFGQSGAGSQSNLRKRFRQYLRDRDRGAKRPKFERLFRNWRDDLLFCFSSLDWDEKELRKLENDLSDAVISFCSSLDYSAKIRRVVAVLRS